MATEERQRRLFYMKLQHNLKLSDDDDDSLGMNSNNESQSSIPDKFYVSFKFGKKSKSKEWRNGRVKQQGPSPSLDQQDGNSSPPSKSPPKCELHRPQGLILAPSKHDSFPMCPGYRPTPSPSISLMPTKPSMIARPGRRNISRTLSEKHPSRCSRDASMHISSLSAHLWHASSGRTAGVARSPTRQRTTTSKAA